MVPVRSLGVHGVGAGPLFRFAGRVRALGVLSGLALSGLASPAPEPLLAQETEERPWSVEGELGANIFFGASEQTTVLFRSGLEHNDDRWEVSLNGSFTYGEAVDQDGVNSVNNRSWTALAGLDYETGRWSPFFFGSGEGSFERAIDLRLTGGIGARYTFVEDDRSRVDLSLATTGEVTQPRRIDGEEQEDVRLVRLSARARVRRRFLEGRGQFNLVTFYRPAMGDSDDYTVDVDTSLSFALNDSFTLKVSLVNRYDNLAVSRGARANNDGRLYFSFLASY